MQTEHCESATHDASQIDRDTPAAAPAHCDHSTVEAAAEHEFKNFHRLLCERFGYFHDDKDWRRDQASLIEWIASQTTSCSSGQPVADAFEFVLNVLEGSTDQRGVMVAMPLAKKIARKVLEEHRRNVVAL
ncbi:hypothetical protein PTKU46_89550 [Paraburkholderia terrae]|uniref:hypothetical protein n=1 Tax=Paraburkholderia terrae TaxID=311230 RepID=UPI0030E55CCB